MSTITSNIELVRDQVRTGLTKPAEALSDLDKMWSGQSRSTRLEDYWNAIVLIEELGAEGALVELRRVRANIGGNEAYATERCPKQ